MLQGDTVVGSITTSDIVETVSKGDMDCNRPVRDIMNIPFPIFDKAVPVEEITLLVSRYQAVLLFDAGKLYGIVTSADFLKLVGLE